jgi:hypothetical protein
MDESNKPPTHFPIRDLKAEEGSEELLDSPAMEPYMRFMLAVMQNQDLRPVLDEIAALPLEDRYVWRIASALKWAFADFDSSVVMADRKTLRRKIGSP